MSGRAGRRIFTALAFAALVAAAAAGCATRYLVYGELDHDAVVEILEDAVRIRGLPPRHPIRFRVVHRETYDAHAADDEDARRAAKDPPGPRLLRQLGVLVGAETVRQARQRVMSSGFVFGFYAGREEGIWIVDAGLRSDLLEVIYAVRGRDPLAGGLVHEIAHALQDQHHDLETFRDTAESSDARLARVALVEGDANLVRSRYDSFLSPGAEAGLFELLIGASGPRSADVYLRELAMFQYGDGMRFVAALHAVGGFGRVDEAFVEPPRSTLEILHPDIYLAGVELEEVALEPPPGTKVLLQDTLGALRLGMFLSDLAPEADLALLTRAWRGDRALLLEAAGGLQARWTVAFAGAEAAARFTELAGKRCPGPTRDGLQVAIVCDGGQP